MNTLPVNTDVPPIGGINIPIDDQGRLSLNAIHRAQGGEKRKAPNEWLRTQQAAELVKQYTQTPNMASGENQTLTARAGNSRLEENQPLTKVHGGNNSGTYAILELALSYAMWISSEMHARVISVYIQWEKSRANTSALPDFSNPADAAEAWAQQYRERQRAEALALEHQQRAEVNQEKANYYDRVNHTRGAHSIDKVAKIFCTHGFQIGPRKLYAWMRANGILTQNNVPYQHHINAGRFVVAERAWKDCYGDHRVSVKALATTKGVLYMAQKLEIEMSPDSLEEATGTSDESVH